MTLESYIEHHDPKGFGFACCGTVWIDGKNFRCGKKTYQILMVGQTTP